MTDRLSTMKVVKRNGKRVEFDGSKIALAVKKGFDSVEKETNSYGLDDVNKVYNKVIEQIKKQEKDSIKIEQIQDLIEQELQKNGYEDVYQSFAEYRERRAKSREAFADEKRLHKFLKLIEKLGLKENSEENANIHNHDPYEMMFTFGATLSEEFSKTYLIKKAYSDAHENGDIHIHDMEFIPMGTIQDCVINLEDIWKNKDVHGIEEYLKEVVILLDKINREHHGEQLIPAFDTSLIPAVQKTFKEQLKQSIVEMLTYSEFDKFVAIGGIEREIERLNTMDLDSIIFDKYTRDTMALKKLFSLAYEQAIEKTDKILTTELSNFLTIIAERQACCIGLGMDTSKEGRLVSKKLLQLGNMENITLIFNVKKGINSAPKEANYDLLEQSIKFPIRYVFLDASFNLNGQVFYTKYARIPQNCIGNLATTTINLPRLGLKYAGKDIKSFYQELDEKLELVKEQLLERFDEQCAKTAGQFSYLMGKGVWKDGEKLNSQDKVRRVLKQGNVSIGYIGLAECVKALTGQGLPDENHLGLAIIKHMKEKTEEFSTKHKINFSLVGTYDRKIAERLIGLDRAIYGKIKQVTDKACYTFAFQMNERSLTTEGIKLEAPYQALTLGGHVTHVTLTQKSNLEETICNILENNLGCVEINLQTEKETN